ncbi:Bug family tripartite tricarboxylate transporter substrate binding protein [Paracraurococcus lichenis]|uniref:Tripartite tricarboxylate transporter substrate binding protein n=1 Tax=Paracraurococcus lichenis TaxID=3064888 RepID=A0ABT9DX70_9PROT|nr:tripartite tricarboxylate transporter substrate binding protein [Paracraurococcus sp. LOR1-02]MDO9708492.1 tripartite tricarboxylate transporter substrate binding protein [Paracraurococcus sp. LOR1-02]
MRRRSLALATLASLLPAAAGAFPDRPITLATGYAPGGSTDIAARILADRLPAYLGPEARVVVENRPGAAGAIATEWLKRQPADGHTLMVTETGAAAAAPAAMVGGTRYDPVTDFTHIGLISTPPAVLVVTERFPGDTPAEALQALRTAPPDRLTYASSGVGGVLHLQAEMLAQAFGTRYVHVPYRSGAQMLQSILTGESQFGVAALASAVPLMREGKVRGIAMLGDRRFPLFPDIPTLGELGVPGFENGGFFMLIAPAGLPPAVAEALNRALNGVLAEPPVRERLLSAGHAPPAGPNGLAETRAFMVREFEKMKAIVAKTGVTLQP